MDLTKKTSKIIHLRRQPNADTRVALFTVAGGRCEFDNCNRYLLKHHVTHESGNFAEMAHIVAFSPGGPRGQSGLNVEDRNRIENLMLLCPTCHKLIDDNSGRFTVETLREFKRDHEARIRMLTEAKADKQTCPLVLKGTIADSPVAIPVAQMREAVVPFYLEPKDVFEICLTNQDEARTAAYWQSGCELIHSRMQIFWERFRQDSRTNISVFALGPIPFLAYLGSRLSNKTPTALFQRHRGTEDWAWKDGNGAVEYCCHVVRQGTDATKVALVLSLSGRVPDSDYAQQLDDEFTVYEIAPTGTEPGFELMPDKGSLEAFRATYRSALQTIVAAHGTAREVRVFPAVPAPAAIAIGLDWMRKTHPSLVVFDKNGAMGFEKAVVISAGQ
jgi:hypothetical protein